MYYKDNVWGVFIMGYYKDYDEKCYYGCNKCCKCDKCNYEYDRCNCGHGYEKYNDCKCDKCCDYKYDKCCNPCEKHENKCCDRCRKAKCKKNEKYECNREYGYGCTPCKSLKQCKCGYGW